MSEPEVTEPPAPVVSGSPQEIADGVYVVPDGRVPLVPNVGIVVGEEAVLVVDTAMGPRNGERIREMAAALAGGRRLVLTITHFHPEHGFGAQAFRNGEIVYNRDQVDEFRDKGSAYLEMFKTFGDNVAQALENVELVEPNTVYDGGMHEIDLGGRSVRLLTWGRAHTRGDQVVFLPDERILFTGDLVEERCFAIFPYFPPEDVDVDGEKWLAVLAQLEALEPATVVPGHGEVGDAGVIADVRDYIALLRAESRRLADEGVAVDEAVEQIEASMRALHADWVQPEWIAFGVRHFYAAHAR
jgi:glyoxylase-like metal-dependent hydrolase (beta-lactamase superfamily II)